MYLRTVCSNNDFCGRLFPSAPRFPFSTPSTSNKISLPERAPLLRMSEFRPRKHLRTSRACEFKTSLSVQLLLTAIQATIVTSEAFDASQVANRTRVKIVLISGFRVLIFAPSRGVGVVKSHLTSQRAQPTVLASQQITILFCYHLEGGHNQKLPQNRLCQLDRRFQIPHGKLLLQFHTHLLST